MPLSKQKPKWLRIGLVLCAVCSLAATCENKDFSKISKLTFNVQNSEDPEPTQIFNTYDARTSVEFTLRNTGDQTLRIIVRAKTITVGDDGSTDEDTGLDDIDFTEDTTAEDTTTEDTTTEDIDMSLDTELDVVDSDISTDVEQDVFDVSTEDTVTSDVVSDTVEDEPTFQIENVCIPLRGALSGSSTPGETMLTLGTDTVDTEAFNACIASCNTNFERSQEGCAQSESPNCLENTERALDTCLDGCEPLPNQISGRFGEDELKTGIGVEISLEVLCPDIPEELGIEDPNCIRQGRGTLEFSVISAQYECSTTSDCADDQACDTTLGRCVGIECGPDRSCSEDQTCDISTCRCRSDSCACDVAGAKPDSTPPWSWLALAGLFMVVGYRRRTTQRAPTQRSSTHAALLSVAIVCSSFMFAETASAQCPLIGNKSSYDRSFDRPGATLYTGTELRFLTGDVGQDAGTGLGMYVGQALQYRYIGFRMAIGTSYFLTEQEPPPIAKGLQLYSLRVGPRAICAIGKLRLFADAEYERVGLISNALVRHTGPGKDFNAFGGAVGLHWMPRPYFMIGARASYASFVDLNGGLASVAFQLGILGGL